MMEALLWFAREMGLKLQVNDWKEPWDCETDVSLLLQLRGELRELTAAIRADNHMAVIEEAADVANYAMMLADNHRTILADIASDAPLQAAPTEGEKDG